MSTRSDIIVHRADGSWKRVYCHFDGYLSGVGAKLLEHYNSQARADEVVLGDISQLGARCDKPKGHTFDKKVQGCTVYYGRDRGETDVDGTAGATKEEVWPKTDSWGEYIYVWDEGHWSVSDPSDEEHRLHDLKEAIARRNAADALGLDDVVTQFGATEPNYPVS